MRSEPEARLSKEEKSMSTAQGAKALTDAELDELCINTIRTLSIDAVQAGQFRAPRHPDGARAAGLHPLESGDALRSAGPDLAQPRSVRAFEWPRLDAAVVRTPPYQDPGRERRLRNTGAALGDPRRHPPLPPTRQQGARPPRVPLGFGRRDHHRPARARRCDQRGHGHRPEVARQPL